MPVPADIRKYGFNPIPSVTTINIDDEDAIQYWYSCMTYMFSIEDISNFPILLL
jgi:hypothetical protein